MLGVLPLRAHCLATCSTFEQMRGEVATASNILFALLVFTVGGCCVLALWCLYASEAQVWGNVGGHHAQPSLYASLDGTQIIFMGSFACGVFIGMVTASLMKYSEIGVRSSPVHPLVCGCQSVQCT